MSVQLAHGVRGPRLHTSCLRRARTFGAAHVRRAVRVKTWERVWTEEVRKSDHPDRAPSGSCNSARQARMERRRHLVTRAWKSSTRYHGGGFLRGGARVAEEFAERGVDGDYA